ncbi:unnamed protein product [Symbiodinium sp. CCMP2592]|nr:unnamed protein product [Symbiodinium sp. CCMP2592]
MDAPVNPAGIPAIDISAARADTEDLNSLPAMSVQDDGTDQVVPGTREGGQVVPLTAEALAVMGQTDPRRGAPGAVSEWAYVSSSAHQHASLAGSPQQHNSVQYSPSEIRNVANYYQQNVLAPTLQQAVHVHQVDTGPAVAAEAEARHRLIMAETSNLHREQFNQLHAQALSGAAQLRLEFAQAESRLQQKEEMLRAAGESMANKHSDELSQMRREAIDYKIKLHQAEVTVSDVVAHAERELANRSRASQDTVAVMNGELSQLKSEMGAFMQVHRQQAESMTKLHQLP